MMRFSPIALAMYLCLTQSACYSSEPEFFEKQATTSIGPILTSSDVVAARDALAVSRSRFNEIRDSPYRYIETYRFAASESREQTTITVEDRNVVSRSYLYYNESEDSWTECYERTSEDIGLRCNDAFPALQMEALYDRCSLSILASELGDADSETGHTIGLSFFSNGILASCTAFPRDCFDDCQSGFSLVAFFEEG